MSRSSLVPTLEGLLCKRRQRLCGQSCARGMDLDWEAQRLVPLVINKGVRLEVQRVRRRQEPWSRQEGLVMARAVAMGMGMRRWCKKCF